MNGGGSLSVFSYLSFYINFKQEGTSRSLKTLRLFFAITILPFFLPDNVKGVASLVDCLRQPLTVCCKNSKVMAKGKNPHPHHSFFLYMQILLFLCVLFVVVSLFNTIYILYIYIWGVKWRKPPFYRPYWVVEIVALFSIFS